MRRAETAVGKHFPEFRAWHAMLKPLFDVEPPDWTEQKPAQAVLELLARAPADDEEEAELEIDEEDEDEEEDDGEEDA